ASCRSSTCTRRRALCATRFASVWSKPRPAVGLDASAVEAAVSGKPLRADGRAPRGFPRRRSFHIDFRLARSRLAAAARAGVVADAKRDSTEWSAPALVAENHARCRPPFEVRVGAGDLQVFDRIRNSLRVFGLRAGQVPASRAGPARTHDSGTGW